MRYGIIDMETGEMIRETNSKQTAKIEADYTLTKEDLLNPSKELVSFMYKQMKLTGRIDKFGMIKVDGVYVSDDFFKVIEISGANAGAIGALKRVLSIRGFIKKTQTTDCRTWTEVMEVLDVEISNKRKVSAVKKIFKDNDIVREARTPSGEKVFVINPNFLRHGSHTSDMCISVFKDITLTKVDRYNTYLMFLNGLINYDDIN